MQRYLRETEPVVEETEEVTDSEALDQGVPVPLIWNIGDYCEDNQGRKGWIKVLNAGIAECVIYGDRVAVENLGLSSLVKKNYMKLTSVEKISNHIAGQPPIHWLDKVKTLDQSKWWKLTHREQYCLSLALRAKYLFLDEPLEAKVQNGQITKGEMTRAWLMADYYSALWDLVQRSFTAIKIELNKKSIELPFDSALDLFFRLCTEMAEYTLLHCFEPYLEVSGKQLEDYIKLYLRDSNGEELKEHLRDRLEKIPHASYLSHKRLEWLTIVLRIAEKKTTNRNPHIKSAWVAYNLALNNLLEKEVKALHEVRFTYAWHKGKSS
jgi:hypothetical protein